MQLEVGDCLDVIKKLDSNSVDLIYLDPPFFTQKLHSLKNRDNSKEYEFDDTWESIEDYIKFIEKRLDECYRVLKTTGSIFLHCDKTASHYLRHLLDAIFGSNNFQSEIIWYYKRWSNSKKGLLNGHQTIYFYSKTSSFKFNKLFQDYSPTTNIDQILQSRVRNKNGKTEYKKNESGEIVLCGAKKGVPLSDVWEIPFLNPKANERVGYPTQKPIILMEQIIKIATDENDIVLDPFAGSGTTLVASKLLNRDYIGIDISNEAINLCADRLENITKTSSALLRKGKNSYQNLSEDIRILLKQFDATPVERNSGIDGFLKINSDIPIAIRIQRKNEMLYDAKQKLLKSCRVKGYKMVLLKTNHMEDDNLSFCSFDDSNILIISSYDLQIKDWINEYSMSKSKEASMP